MFVRLVVAVQQRPFDFRCIPHRACRVVTHFNIPADIDARKCSGADVLVDRVGDACIHRPALVACNVAAGNGVEVVGERAILGRKRCDLAQSHPGINAGYR